MDYAIVQGDVTANIDSPTIITHCCNDVGRMGKGIALTLARKWPSVERSYTRWRQVGQDMVPFKQGQIQLVPVDENLTICNLIGQSGLYAYRGLPPVRYEAIREGMLRLAEAVEKVFPKPVLRFPKLGCGLAGGQWENVEKIITDVFENMDVTIRVYELPA